MNMFLKLIGKTFSAILLVGICSNSFAQESALIRFVPPGSQQASYILAVLHHPSATYIQWQHVPDEVFPLVNTVAFEWLPEDYETEQIRSVMQVRDDKNLKKYYKREDNIRYELMILNTLRDPVEKYADLTPLYTMEIFRDFQRGNGRWYAENQLYQFAVENTKPVLSLLSLRQIAEQIFSLPFETQADILSYYVNQIETYNNYQKALYNTYLQQDLNEIATQQQLAEHPLWWLTIRNGLNASLVEKILQLSASQSVLYVIDAERMGGSGGILDMLQANGATLSDMPFALPTGDEVNQYFTGVNQSGPDDFPEYLLASETANAEKPFNRLIMVEELKQQKPVPKAQKDPFGDQYDYLMTDTSFLSEWSELRSNDAFFSIRMPEKAKWEESITESLNGPIRTYTANVNHARSDLFYSAGYTIYPANFNLEQKGPFFDDFVFRSVRKLNGDLLAQRVLSGPEYNGREFVVMVSDSFYVRSMILLRGNILYQLLTGGPADKPYSPYAEEFLRSFKLDEGKSTNWFTQTEAWIRCDFPRQPLIQNKSFNTQYGPLQVRTFNAEDFNEGISYFLSISTYPPNYPFGSEKSFYESLITDAEKQYFGRAISNEKIKKGKYQGREVVLQLNNGKVYRMHFFLVNQVAYQYLAGGLPGAMQSANVGYFLDHFEFLEIE